MSTMSRLCRWLNRETGKFCGTYAAYPHGFVGARSTKFEVRYLCRDHWRQLVAFWTEFVVETHG